MLFKPTDVVPPADVTNPETASLLVDGARLRYEYRSKVYSVGDKSWADLNYRSIYDGKTGAYLEDDQTYLYVSRDAGPRPPHVSSIFSFPALLTLRPAEPVLTGFGIGTFDVTGRTVTVDKTVCVELSYSGAPGNATKVLVDPARNYLPMRTQRVIESGPYSVMQCDFSYAAHDRLGWSPTGWRWSAVVRKGGTVALSVRATVTEFEVEASIQPMAFDTSAPPNSLVEDATGEKLERYVVRPDGSRRAVAPGEMHKPFEVLLATEPGGGPRLSWWGRNWRLVAAALTVGGLIGLVCFRYGYFRARKSTSGGSS
ncbi:hypothetical protein R5W23_002325 [Gemmata sp. JC673]|uniref:DUF3068 domain-containing protein n=1 Tax=Gemmata algarum TaxID=2975278 RepID=A0ABU5F0H1_9BACT|nr:hypothetical protein [Gemmata algarum]MDY3561066.1 hypothetical protein [Gemmata algarum]